MPNNVPAHLKAKFDRCVADVEQTGKSTDAAYAICYTSIVEAPRRLLAILSGFNSPESSVLLEAERFTPRQLAVSKVLQQRGVMLEAGARHTQREFEIIEQVIRLMTELHGEIEDLDALVNTVQEALGEPTLVDYLVSTIHRTFTTEADRLFGEGGRLDQPERIFLSHAIGAALDAFNKCIDVEIPHLRERLLYTPSEPYTPTATTIVNIDNPSEVEIKPGEPGGEDTRLPSINNPANQGENDLDYLESRRGVQAAAQTSRDLFESVLGQVGLDANGNLAGIVVVEGRSDNGNVYTEAALRTVPAIFAGAQMFVNHPTVTEEMERPEGDLYDLVGRLPLNASDFYIDTVTEGRYAGRKASFFRNGFLSETADWLKTKIREGLAGDMSIRAQGRGMEENGDFVVEAFTVARSLDFVTRAAAGGRAQLLEATRRLHEGGALLTTLTLEQLVEARPDLVAALRTREGDATRDKSMHEVQEANRMTVVNLTEAQKKIVRLTAELRRAKRTARQTEAEKVVGEALAQSALPVEAQARVRTLAESAVKSFVEAEPAPAAEPAGTLAPAGTGLNPGDPATIELPPDVAELPTGAQETWLETYVQELPKGEERAVNLAWAGVYAEGWVKGESGWYREQAAQPALPPDAMPNAVPVAASTAESLRAAITTAIAGEKTYLAKMSEAGRVSGLGGGGGVGGQPVASEADALLLEAYKGWGLTDKQAKVAVQGR